MEVVHLLALKVMRLTRPTLVAENPLVTFDERDLLGRSSLHSGVSQGVTCSNKEELAILTDPRKIRLSGMLSLPQNFGNIYLGETFTAYVSVHNDSNFLCHDIIVKADLQTNSNKVSMMAGPMEPVSELPPDRSIDQVLTHEVKELGAHILVCTVSYTGEEKLFFKKYFKFQVQRPLEVKTDFTTTDTDEIFLEARIQNTSSTPIFLEKVFLEPSIGIQLLSTPEVEVIERQDDLTITSCLREMEVRQVLYRFKPLLAPSSPRDVTTPVAANSKEEDMLSVGKLDITWRSHMGQRARLQTSELKTSLPDGTKPKLEDIRVTVEQVPASVKLDSVFHLFCRITNQSVRSLELRLSASTTSGALQLCGSVSRSLAPLQSGRSEQLDLQVLALLPGLHSVSGLVLTDCLINRSYGFDDLVQVLVQP